MNNSTDLLNTICSASDYIIDDEFYFKKLYLELQNEYSDYTMNNLLTICKIDMLKLLKCISDEIHDYLIELFNTKIELEDKLNYLDDEEEIDKIANEINNIESLLFKYKVYPITIISLLVSDIDRNYYDSIKNMRLKK